jgi:hypothetical protein
VKLRQAGKESLLQYDYVVIPQAEVPPMYFRVLSQAVPSVYGSAADQAREGTDTTTSVEAR